MESSAKTLINEFLVEFFQSKLPNFNKPFPKNIPFLVYSRNNALVNLSVSLKEKGMKKNTT